MSRLNTLNQKAAKHGHNASICTVFSSKNDCAHCLIPNIQQCIALYPRISIKDTLKEANYHE